MNQLEIGRTSDESTRLLAICRAITASILDAMHTRWTKTDVRPATVLLHAIKDDRIRQDL